MADEKQCEHRLLTSFGRGWECSRCGIGILSLAVPLPMPLVIEALRVLASPPLEHQSTRMEKQE